MELDLCSSLRTSSTDNATLGDRSHGVSPEPQIQPFISCLYRGGLFSLEFIRRNRHTVGAIRSPSNGLGGINDISQPTLYGKANMAHIEPLEPPDSCEPPLRSSSKSSLFFIGRDSAGNWVVRDEAGLCGGLFVNRSEAVRFAMRENGRHSRAVVGVPGILELTADFRPHDLTGRHRDRSVKAAAH
jgi:hypothetical protein